MLPTRRCFPSINHPKSGSFLCDTLHGMQIEATDIEQATQLRLRQEFRGVLHFDTASLYIAKYEKVY
jgi:hypothetical protein